MNDELFLDLILQKGGVLPALVELACLLDDDERDFNVSTLADELGMARQVLEQAATKYDGRRYAHVRRSIEAQMQLSTYTLDKVIDE